ncbi:hypothetical protein ES702_07040 [subsurface metagenome]
MGPPNAEHYHHEKYWLESQACCMCRQTLSTRRRYWYLFVLVQPSIQICLVYPYLELCVGDS